MLCAQSARSLAGFPVSKHAGENRSSCLRECQMPWAVKFPWDSQQLLRHPTQIYAVLWELAVYSILIVMEKRQVNETRPGEIFFLWVFLHSIGRLLMEYYRDDFRGSALNGLSISTWVSLILMSLSGCWLAFQSQKKIRL